MPIKKLIKNRNYPLLCYSSSLFLQGKECQPEIISKWLLNYSNSLQKSNGFTKPILFYRTKARTQKLFSFSSIIRSPVAFSSSSYCKLLLLIGLQKYMRVVILERISVWKFKGDDGAATLPRMMCTRRDHCKK